MRFAHHQLFTATMWQMATPWPATMCFQMKQFTNETFFLKEGERQTRNRREKKTCIMWLGSNLKGELGERELIGQRQQQSTHAK